MFRAFRQIRPGEGRDTFVGMATLFLLMAAHALLETARDALFLSHIDATQLPFVYIGVAVAAFGVASLQERGPSGRVALAGWMVFAGVSTIAFWPLIGTGDWVLYALYIWSAVIVTVALARVFILLGERFTVTQAKRLYATIGAGSVVGAIGGSGAAGVLATMMDAKQLLVLAGGVLIVGAVAPLLLTATEKPPESTLPTGAKPKPPSPWKSTQEVLAHPYARRVALLMVLFTLTFTLVDFVFKNEVANEVAPDALPVLLARVYFVLNVGSLVVQLFVVRWIVRVAGPTRTLAVLPALIAVGGLGLLFGGGLYAGIGMKGADGSLRHSMHRTASELLYVPMSRSLRTAAKNFIDIAAHRGGQAVASVAILALTALGVHLDYLGAAIAVLAGAAAFCAMELRQHYLDVFRHRLSEAAERQHVDDPALDLESLESLIAALNSPDDQRVKTVIKLLAERGRAHLIPGLILYHPSPDVLAVALDELAETGRTDFLHLADRLLDHEYADVRAAALRARMKLAPNEELIRAKLEVTCPVVRTTALVGLTSGGWAPLRETEADLDAVVEEGSNVAKEALARAIRYGRPLVFDDYLVKLARVDDDTVLCSVALSMRESPNARFIAPLVRMLSRRKVREHATLALVALGEVAISALEGILSDDDEPGSVRRHLPAVIRRFGPERAAEVLTRQLVEVNDGEVRYRILRAMNWLLVEHPDVELDRRALSKAMEKSLSKAFRRLDWRLVLERGAKQDATRKTDAHDLLVKMLSDKESNTIERMFRVLALQHPSQDLRTIYRGLRSKRADVRASSRELIESFVEPRFRSAVLGLIDEADGAERLRASGSFHTPTKLDYEALLQAMLDTGSESLRCLAVYHIGELGLTELRPSLEAIETDAPNALATVIRQTIESLKPPPPEPAT